MSKKDNKCITREDLEKKIQELAFIIDEVEDEKLEIENKLKKALADYINLEGGISKRVEMKLEQEKLILARELIEVMDDFYYALQADKDLKIDNAVKSWVEGMKNTVEKIKKILGNLGVQMIDVKKNTEFDMNKCEAIGVVNEGRNNMIHEVAQPGYIMGENIVRPARVIVCKK